MIAPANEPMIPLRRKARPSPAIRLARRPPRNDPRIPATRALPHSTPRADRPTMSCAAAPTSIPNKMIPSRSMVRDYRQRRNLLTSGTSCADLQELISWPERVASRWLAALRPSVTGRRGRRRGARLRPPRRTGPALDGRRGPPDRADRPDRRPMSAAVPGRSSGRKCSGSSGITRLHVGSRGPVRGLAPPGRRRSLGHRARSRSRGRARGGG